MSDTVYIIFENEEVYGVFADIDEAERVLDILIEESPSSEFYVESYGLIQ